MQQGGVSPEPFLTFARARVALPAPDTGLPVPPRLRSSWPCGFSEVTRAGHSGPAAGRRASELFPYAYVCFYSCRGGPRVRRVEAAKRKGTVCDLCQSAECTLYGKYTSRKNSFQAASSWNFRRTYDSLSNINYWGLLVNIHNTVSHKQPRSETC